MPRMEKNRSFRGNVRIWYVQIIRYLDQIEFECAEGKKIIYRMDREKEDIGWDGNLAVAVYVEAQDRLCMESPRMLSQFIERDWGDADQG